MRSVEFEEQPALSTGVASSAQAPFSTQAAYFDEDDAMDILIYNSTSNSDVVGESSLTLLDGSSRFRDVRGPFPWRSLGGDGPGQLDELLAVDVNHDGIFDVGGSSTFALSASDGQITTPTNIGEANGLRVWGDVDGDGLLDYIFGRRQGDLEVSVGTAVWPAFAQPVHSPNPVTDGIPASSILFERLLDVSGDENADFVGFRVDGDVEGAHSSSLLVLHGDGRGKFSEPETNQFTTDTLLEATTGDFNCDRLADWVTSTSADTESVAVLLRTNGAWEKSGTWR